jgi:hypothetical protein
MLSMLSVVSMVSPWCPHGVPMVPGVGKYLEGGKDAGGQLVDQRFCPRIVEGASLDEATMSCGCWVNAGKTRQPVDSAPL